ncbi:MAG TPA: hypothetical protein VG936_03750 [Lacunisphaera sp.]|nr:hypothetical protein [Lacunisphaera sp.]
MSTALRGAGLVKPCQTRRNVAAGACAASGPNYGEAMKKFAVLVAALLAAGLSCAETTTPATKAGPTAATSAKATDAKAAKKDDKKKEEEPKIPGVVITRPNGTYLGLEVASTKFKLSFYDKKKKPMAIDVTRATARWPNTRSAAVAWNFTVLNPSGKALIGAKPVLPPYSWNVILTLLQGEGDDAKAVETYTVPFRG